MVDELLNWHKGVERNMPWKQTIEPYKIWMSEIILQQTRVAQGLPYYVKFIEAFPTIQDLAQASVDDVLKLWQGLGYYSRARNMHFTANVIVERHNGIFPKEYHEVLALKGVGKYTAAAIMSFAYGKHFPVVDGNVLRVVSRLHGIQSAIDDKETISQIYNLSNKYISKTDPAKYNQAIMDFGALACTPKNPKCSECPFNNNCIANKENLVSIIPYKAKKIKKTKRYFHYIHIVSRDNHAIINHRFQKGIWQGLYDMPLLEKAIDEQLSETQIVEFLTLSFALSNIDLVSTTDLYKHELTHQTILARFYLIETNEIGSVQHPFIKVIESDISKYAQPKLIVNYLKDYDLCEG